MTGFEGDHFDPEVLGELWEMNPDGSPIERTGDVPNSAGVAFEATNHPLLVHLRTGAWLNGETFPPLAWVVPDLIPEGMSLLVGGPKIGKSWLSLDIALAVASGGKVLGRVTVDQPRPVLLLALEDGDRRIQDRSRHLMAGQPIPDLLHYMTRIEPGTAVATIEAWINQHAPRPAQPLVILDTLGKVLPPTAPGESPYQRDYRVTGRLKRIADDRPGMALLALHHDRKAQADDFVDDVSGTNGIAGAVDTLIVIARPRTEQRGLFKVTGRDVNEREYAVSVTPEAGWQLIGVDLDTAAANAQTVRATVNLSDRTAEILRFVFGHPDGVRPGEVAKAVDISADDAGRYLRRLHDAEKIRKLERGLYAPPVLSVRVSEAETPVRTHRHNGRPLVTDEACSVCDQPLAAALIDQGETTHPTCEVES